MAPITEPRSGTADWPLLRALAGWEGRLAARAARSGRLAGTAYELLRFGIKQAWACLFGGLLLAPILASHPRYPHHAPLARYDASVIASLLRQPVPASKLASWFLLMLISYTMVAFANAGTGGLISRPHELSPDRRPA